MDRMREELLLREDFEHIVIHLKTVPMDWPLQTLRDVSGLGKWMGIEIESRVSSRLWST